MALTSRSVLNALSSATNSMVRSFIVNWGLLALTLSIVLAGSLAFALVTVPPGTIPYP